MTKSIVISERDNIAAVMDNSKVTEFYIHRGDMLLGDVYLAQVENILPSIDAAFVNVGGDRMGFLHASDVAGKGALKDKLKPKQPLLVQIIKEPTGHKGPRVTTSISLPGRFLVLMPDEKGISVSRKIVSAKERGRLKSVVSLLKPTGVGVIIRTEAENQSESEIQEDLEFLLEKWNNIVSLADTVTPPSLLYRDQDLLYRVIREACTEDVKEIVVDTPFALHRANQLLQSWNIGSGINVTCYKGTDPLLTSKGIDKEIRGALQTKVNLPSGGYLYIQTTEALTVIDVNSGKFTSSATQGETIRKTNIEAVAEIARQLKLRNIGGMIIIDFIDMENRVDQLAVLEELEMALEPDKAKPQVGQLSDLGLVELTRHRQGQSLAEIFTKKCPACSGSGAVIEEFNFAAPPQETNDFKAKNQKVRIPQKLVNTNNKPANGAQKQQAEISQTLETERTQQQKKINTSPSLVATAQKVRKPEKIDAQISELNSDVIKQTFTSAGFIPNISKVVVFSAVPPQIARNYMDQATYIVDVFSILQELESAELVAGQTNEPVKQYQPAQNMTERPRAVMGQAPKQGNRFDKHKHYNHYQQGQQQRQPQQGQQIRPQQQVQPQVQQPVKQEITPVKPQENIEVVEQPKLINEVQETQKAEPKAEAPEKKVVRRGRKPAAKSATSKTTKKKTTSKSETSKEE